MIYAPNTKKWKTGDVVIHDADAKTARMLMRITGGTAKGTYFTRYLNKKVDGARYENALEVLHDPARFGIERPNDVDGPRYSHWSKEAKADANKHEAVLVRPGPTENHICRAYSPDAAEWIAGRLNMAAKLEALANKLHTAEAAKDQREWVACIDAIYRATHLPANGAGETMNRPTDSSPPLAVRLDRRVGRFVAGMVCSVDFALGRANVRLLPWKHNYRSHPDHPGGVVWHVADTKTGHQDFVGEEWLTPNDRVEGRDAASSRRVPSHDGLCPDGGAE